MQAPYIRNKFYLHRAKVILLLCVLVGSSVQAQSFLYARKNNPNYDNRKLTYGFLIGLHTSTYEIKYSDSIVNKSLDTLHSVVSDWRPGFSLGFIVNYRIAEFVDLRITPTVAFYEHKLKYLYTDNTSAEVLVETTMVELPFLIKYKSARRGNVRAYMVGGFKPALEASGKKQEENNAKGIDIKSVNMSLEGGLGFDLYFPLFKFSPEIRFSRGIMNIMDDSKNAYGKPLKYVNTNLITIYLLFQ